MDVITAITDAFGPPKHLDTVMRSVRDSGNKPHVAHTQSAAISDFRKLYKHNSINPEWFERWCFERWFTIRDYMEEHKLNVAFVIDCDMLVYPGLDELYAKLPPNTLYTLPAVAPFMALEGVGHICDYITSIFQSNLAETICKLASYPGHESVQDYKIITHHLQNLAPDLYVDYRPMVIDRNWCLPINDLPLVDNHKDIEFRNGIPYVDEYQMVTLHYWGSKDHLNSIYACKNGKLHCLGTPLDYKDWMQI